MSLFLTESDSKSNQGVNKNHVKQALRKADPVNLKNVLLDYKKNPQFEQDVLNDALMQCTKQEQVDLIPVLLECGADPNFGEFRTPLQWALMMNKEQSVEALVKGGADINYGEPPPITMAASLGRLKSIQLFIEKGADVTLEDSDHRTALDLAENYKHTEIARLLRSAGCYRNASAVLGHY